jgi:hypothetical protein
VAVAPTRKIGETTLLELKGTRSTYADFSKQGKPAPGREGACPHFSLGHAPKIGSA